MAMTQCPQCGGTVSEKAEKCVHCDAVLIKGCENSEATGVCDECGTPISSTDIVCGVCGCPVEKNEEASIETPQQVEISKINITTKSKKIIIGIIGAVVLFVLGSVLINSFSSTSYVDTLDEARYLMLAGAGEAEDLCNLTLKVWYNAMNEVRDTSTNAYTCKMVTSNAYQFVDFSTAISTLYTDETTTDILSYLSENEADVKSLMKDLQNPPSELENCYESITELNVAYGMLMDIVASPTGSYSSYGTEKSSAISTFVAAFDKLDTQMPE